MNSSYASQFTLYQQRYTCNYLSCDQCTCQLLRLMIDLLWVPRLQLSNVVCDGCTAIGTQYCWYVYCTHAWPTSTALSYKNSCLREAFHDHQPQPMNTLKIWEKHWQLTPQGLSTLTIFWPNCVMSYLPCLFDHQWEMQRYASLFIFWHPDSLDSFLSSNLSLGTELSSLH